MSRSLEIAVAVLNGAIGDHLERRGNGLATEMAFVQQGRPVPVAALGLDERRVVLLIHGLMAEESAWLFPDGSDYGQRLRADLGLAPLYLRYNSGLAIPDNGARLAALLQELDERFALEELVLIGHSMGGLVLRSACHVASESRLGWLTKLRRDFFLGTPHLGAPLERVGRTITRVLHLVPDPITRLVAVVGDRRSSGVKDLGDPAHPVPLLPGIHHHLVAGTISDDPRIAALFGDLMVSVASATGMEAQDCFIARGVSHNALAHSDLVYKKLLEWLREEA